MRRSSREEAALVAAAFIFGVGASACSGPSGQDDRGSSTRSQRPARGSDLEVGLMRYRPMPAKLYAGFPTGSRLTRLHGCLQFSGNFIVWPQDAIWTASTRAVELADADGSTIHVPLGGTFPDADLGGGGFPLGALSRYADEPTLRALRGCLEASGLVVSPSSSVWIIN